ncbi:MAG: hypothetical protein PHD61_02060 [Bacteroidales bacterium]|nr:hypothetical protein [Bacteroidales bacterium]
MQWLTDLFTNDSIATSDAPAITYATVYPMTMFLRILVAQLLIILFV